MKPGNYKHGGYGTLEYQTYQNMKSRCYNQGGRDYWLYGARGVIVCERWLGKDGFKNFLADMGKKPTPRHSIDRINNNGIYEPGNCRWVLQDVQNKNSRNTKWLTLDGKRICQADLARLLGVRSTTVANLLKRGLSAEQIRDRFQFAEIC